MTQYRVKHKTSDLAQMSPQVPAPAPGSTPENILQQLVDPLLSSGAQGRMTRLKGESSQY